MKVWNPSKQSIRICNSIGRMPLFQSGRYEIIPRQMHFLSVVRGVRLISSALEAEIYASSNLALPTFCDGEIAIHIRFRNVHQKCMRVEVSLEVLWACGEIGRRIVPKTRWCEHRIGSSPITPTFLGRLAEWFITLVLKTRGPKGSLSSNLRSSSFRCCLGVGNLSLSVKQTCIALRWFNSNRHHNLGTVAQLIVAIAS